MAIKRRKPAVESEGASAPSTSSGSRFKKRDIPNTGILENPNSELAAVIKKITDSGDYGHAFHVANSRKFATPRLETGVLALDLTLGGGLGMGRASMLYGERSAGKSTTGLIAMARIQKERPDEVVAVIDAEGCIAEDSLMIDAIDGRVMTAREVFESRVRLRTLAYNPVTKQVEPASFTAWFDNGVKPVIRLSTKTTSISATENHKFLTWVDGAPEWVRADKLKVGDLVARPKSIKYVWPEKSYVTDTVCRWLGYMIGDGEFRERGSFVFTSVDQDIVNDMQSLTARLGSDLVSFSNRHHRITGSYGEKASKHHQTEWAKIVTRLGLLGTKSYNKFIPTKVMEGTRSNCAELLSGLYLTDGHVNKVRPSIAYSTTSRVLLEQVRLLWQRFGIVGRVYEQTYDNPKHRTGYVLTINGRDNMLAVRQVLRLVGYKKDALDYWCSTKPTRPKASTVTHSPMYMELSDKQRASCEPDEYANTSGVWWDTIIDVSDGGVAQTYDFTVEGLHNFTTNDMVAHNTFDKGWAKKLGCDLSRIVIAEPESGEHAIDLADAMMRAKEVSMVVTDSIAALIPTKEIDESAMQEFMGLQARLIGKYVRKATQALLSERKRDHLVHCLFLNQFRMKIGLVFGDPRTLPGGKALEFFMSQQAEIKNKEHFGKDDSGDEVVMYNEHNIKVTKNKMGGPLREAMFRLVRSPHSGMPEAWVDQAKTVVSSGMKVGVVTGAPSSFGIDGVNGKFRGAPALTEWAVENPDAYSTVISKIVAGYKNKWGLE